MERRKVVKKNEPRTIKQPGNTKFPVVLYFFNRPLLYKAFNAIAEEKGIPLRKLIMSFAALGLKAYLKNTGQAFKDDSEQAFEDD